MSTGQLEPEDGVCDRCGQPLSAAPCNEDGTPWTRKRPSPLPDMLMSEEAETVASCLDCAAEEDGRLRLTGHGWERS